MTRKIRWGIIGSGGIARRRTIPAGFSKAKNAELSAVFDSNPQVNAEVARQFQVRPATSVDELLAANIEAIYVATPAYLHYEHVEACAKAGKHVLCEKPLGMAVNEAAEMIELCDWMKVKLGCAFMMRFVAQHQEALQLIRQGRLGRLVYARAQLSCWYPPLAGAWRQDPATGGGGSLIDLGGHCIDLLEMFFGNVVKVACLTNNTIHGYESEDSAVATLFFENGALGTVDTFFCIPDTGSRNVLELYGSKGSILAQGTIGQGPAGQMTAWLEDDSRAYDAQQSRAGSQGLMIAPEPVNTYQAEIEEFSNAIIEDREPLLTGALGLRSQKILAACYASAKSGQTVEVVC